MPKRSNSFQRLVASIAAQLAPAGAKVTESHQTEERGLDGILREIDTLIEFDSGLMTVRVGIESRDRSRKSDIEWIDSIIGKYVDLPVHAKIAVSRKPFSKSAQKKAARHGIKLLSMREAEEVDWIGRFVNIGAATLMQRLHLVRIQFTTIPPMGCAVAATQPLVRTDGVRHEDVTVGELRDGLWPDIHARMEKYLRENFMEVHKTLADLDRPMVIADKLPLRNWALPKESTLHVVTHMTWIALVTKKHEKVPVTREMLGDVALITSGTATVKNKKLRFSAVQANGKPEGFMIIDEVTKD